MPRVPHSSRRAVIYKSTLIHAIAGMLVVLTPIEAHHSTAPYDLIHGTVIAGVVVKFAWENPHAHIYLDVTGEVDATGKEYVIEHWTLETESPGHLTRLGWSKETLKPGDKVTVMGSRARNGSFNLRVVSVELPGGKKLMALPFTEPRQ